MPSLAHFSISQSGRSLELPRSATLFFSTPCYKRNEQRSFCVVYSRSGCSTVLPQRRVSQGYFRIHGLGINQLSISRDTRAPLSLCSAPSHPQERPLVKLQWSCLAAEKLSGECPRIWMTEGPAPTALERKKKKSNPLQSKVYSSRASPSRCFVTWPFCGSTC